MKEQKNTFPYLDLSHDRTFKTFFSQNTELLLSLLKAFLPLPDKKSVQSVRFIQSKEEKQKAQATKRSSQKLQSESSLTLQDSFLYAPSVREKQVVLDLNVSLNTGEKVDVEMPRAPRGDFRRGSCFILVTL